MISYKNIPQDLIIHYNVETYRKIEKLMDISEKNGATVHFHFMLALLGLKTKNKIPLDFNNSKDDDKRSFSLRTLYQKEATSFETYFGLITILDNMDQDYNEVVKNLAFEKTEVNNVSFLKMTNVKTFYSYVLSGLDVIKKDFFYYGDDPINVADQIHEYLESESDLVYEALDLVLESIENNNE